MLIPRLLLAFVFAFIFSISANATSVSSGGTGSVGILTDLGSFSAGTYLITGSGTVDLIGSGGTMTMNPDGTPTTAVTNSSYLYFNPSGSFLADGVYGPAGSNAKMGALIGTLNSAPVSASDWFLIGYSTTITLATAGHIYASVNDTYHDNDYGSFNATVSAVPEPDSYAMLLAGLGVMGFIIRRSK